MTMRRRTSSRRHSSGLRAKPGPAVAVPGRLQPGHEPISPAERRRSLPGPVRSDRIRWRDHVSRSDRRPPGAHRGDGASPGGTSARISPRARPRRAGLLGPRHRRCDRPIRGRHADPDVPGTDAHARRPRGGGRMMLDHERFLELAATSIDFPLPPAESTELEQHLASCTECRRTVQAMREDARAIAASPVRVMARDRSEAVLAGALSRRRPTANLRLALLAAVLALGAIGGLSIGAQVVRNLLDSRVVVVPTPTIPVVAEPSLEPTQTPTTSPAPFAWSSGGDLVVARSDHAAAQLADGRVLATGGHDASLTATASTELRDPATGSWASGPDMATARELHAEVALPDGSALVIGGVGSGGKSLASTELFDPTANAWSAAAPMAHARSSFAAARLPDGNILVVGGY